MRHDDDAYARWIEELRPALIRYARDRLGGDRTEAEDVVQEATVRALVALRSGQVPANPRAWMYVIVRNRCHDVRGARPPADPLDDALRSGAPGPDEEVATRRRLGAVVDAIGALPPAQRRALVGATFEGRPYEEIAAREATSVQAVKSLVHRARRGLEASGARAAALMPFGLRDQVASLFAQHGAAVASVAAVAVAVPAVPLEAPHVAAPRHAHAAPTRAAAAASSAAAAQPAATTASKRAAPAPSSVDSAGVRAAAVAAARRVCAARAAVEAEYGGACDESSQPFE